MKTITGEFSVFRITYKREMACYDDYAKRQTTCWVDESRIIIVESGDAQPAIDLLRREVLEYVDPSGRADAPVNTVRGFRITNVEHICESQTILQKSVANA